MCCTWFAHKCALATWAYMLETVRGAVRRLSKSRIMPFTAVIIIIKWLSLHVQNHNIVLTVPLLSSGHCRCGHWDFFFFFFFFFAFPSYISGVHHIWVRFLHMWPFFNPTMKVVTFRLCGWCVLGVCLLPAFTRLGHESQDLLSLCDEMHVCTD